MKEDTVYQFTAENGLEVRLRPMRASDGPHLVDIFEHMSSESRYARFNVSLSDPDPDWVAQQAAQLAFLPPNEGKAWLAFADLPQEPDAPIGGIRYVVVELRVAEVSLVVRDDLQGLGIGTELMRFAGRAAYADGLCTLLGYVQSDNRAMWQTLERLGVPCRRTLEGTHTIIEVDLREAEPYWNADKTDGSAQK